MSSEKRVAEIKAKWERLKSPPPNMSGGAYATAVALWAAINVDYLIARAEFADAMLAARSENNGE